ncbi:unnamed protein product [Spirodela intermedia]|uniref:Uncharacterized protein n=1 Tax=Spirodela intermedia TaxID=51605 RepID=A0A7I8JHF8_SPIIN|nr:unnamed protein product [Spirodela intermedia]CAA6668852.1 unnamed protein product [Spirodela intermedia]
MGRGTRAGGGGGGGRRGRSGSCRNTCRQETASPGREQNSRSRMWLRCESSVDCPLLCFVVPLRR